MSDKAIEVCFIDYSLDWIDPVKKLIIDDNEIDVDTLENGVYKQEAKHIYVNNGYCNHNCINTIGYRIYDRGNDDYYENPLKRKETAGETYD